MAIPTIVLEKAENQYLMVKTIGHTFKKMVKVGQFIDFSGNNLDDEGNVWVIFQDGSSMLAGYSLATLLLEKDGTFFMETGLTHEDYEEFIQIDEGDAFEV